MYVGDLAFHFKEDLKAIIGFGIDRYRTPPSKALYLQLYRERSVGMSNAGTFNDHCGVHGTNMNGTVTVT